MEAGVPTREIYWNVSQIWLMYVLLVPTVGIAAYGIWRRVRLWRAGQEAVRFDRLGERCLLFLRNAVLQGRNNRQRFVAIFHTGLFAGFIVLFLATTVVAIHEDSHYVGLDLPIMQGSFYLYFQSFLVDLFGLWVLLGVVLAGWRRWTKKPRQLVYTDQASWILIAIFVIVFTGFLVEGWRIAVTDDPWGRWSPVGYVFGMASDAVMSDGAMSAVHRGSWWFHLAAAFGFIAWAPYTKMAHVLTSPLNVFTANLDGPGKSLKTIDFETAERLGVNHLADFSWKDLLDLDACTECGRCTAACPANTVGKALSPRDIILDLQKLMHRSEQPLLASIAARKAAGANGDGTPAPPSEGEAATIPVIDAETAVSPDALFQCTTCAACMEACPVHIEQMPKIVDARRFLVMEEAEFPEGMMAAVTSLESRQHPFSGTQFNRVDWAEGLELDVMAEMDSPEDAEVLFWVGCGGALVERNQETVRATAKLLKKAGVKFAILGREETCSGDPARRIGNEFLFEMLAKGNVDTLNRYGVKQVVTSCPHCFNTFKNEYPEFGGQYQVHHHSQFLEDLVRRGKLEVPNETLSRRDGKRVVFHDPCYLGRHNGEYEAPRKVLDATAPLVPRPEIERSRNNSFCCGGGGGMAFVDEPPTQRVNQERAQQLLDADPDVVAVGCPFCTTMLEDGINARKGDREVTVLDVAQVLLEAVGDDAVNDAGSQQPAPQAGG